MHPTNPPSNPGDSPFLRPGSVARANTLAIIQLAKDDLVPVYLRESQGEHDGYKEGHVLNTRFGSFPHQTMIGVPWGSQVRASNVDTGSRGRRKKNQRSQAKSEEASDEEEDMPTPAGAGRDKGNNQEEAQDASATLKRKRDANDEGEKRTKSTHAQPAVATASVTVQENSATEQRIAQTAQKKNSNNNNTAVTTAAASGFVHILPPTPEIWTSSLPHRTQVVYTPDYSYVLQRIRARPGTRLIEAGSGSGSFTHASARAVYDGNTSTSTGKVFSFEFHEQRFGKMKKEVQEHGLNGLVEVNHRDVYNEGFLVDGKSPEADAVFLDLPAPWLALPHLSRQRPTLTNSNDANNKSEAVNSSDKGEWISSLNPRKSVYICTFSPCIEQVTRTVSEMRKLGWVDIEMVEISHKRIQVFREKIGLNIVSERGMQQAPKDVTEALAKLKEIEVKAAEHNAKMTAQHARRKGAVEDDDDDDDNDDDDAEERNQHSSKRISDETPTLSNKDGAAVKPSFLQGQLVTRSESEIKAHTSYLVFAILPREWTEEDEAAAAAKWPVSKGSQQRVIGAMDRAARKQAKREQMQGARQKNQKVKEDGRAKGKAKEAAAAATAASGAGGQNIDVEMNG